MKPIDYHILNGDALKAQFPEEIPGEIIVMRECLIEGPVAGRSIEEILDNRARFITNEYGGTEDEYHNTVGAEVKSVYASDITRTFPVSKTFTNQQREIYQIVLDAEERAIEACKVGVPYREVHFLASKVIAEGLKAVGIMKGDTEEAVAAGAHT